MILKGAEIFIECLKKEGVDVIFGYPGGKVLDIYDAIYNQKDVRHILVRHEQAAAHAADGYARTTGKVGVCLATSGPGATNLVTGIATANMDSIPIVAFTGQVGTGEIGTDAFQEADMTGITQPITKHNYLVKDVKDLAATIKEAFHVARSGRPGPVLVDLPIDVCKDSCEFVYPKTVDMPNYQPTIKGNPKQLKQAIEWIKNSSRPVIIAGGGVISAGGALELRKFAKQTNLPVATTLMAMGALSSADKNNLGMPGMHGTAVANFAIHHSDLIVAIGMRFDDRITGKISEFGKSAKIIHIDIDPAEINKVVAAHLPIIGDAFEVLKDLNARAAEEKFDKRTKWHQQLNEWRQSHPLYYEKNKKAIKPQEVIEQICEQVSDDAVFVTDVGEHQMWAAQFINFKKPAHWASSGGLGTMGYGFPAAIGAAFGNPKSEIICITGDGSFQMNLQELSTVATHNVPVKIFIMNNGYLGMVRQWQSLFYGGRFSQTDITNCQPDFIKLAEAYGIKGVTISKPEEIKTKLKESLKHNGPVLINVLIDRDENVLPMVPPGGVLNKMIMHEKIEGKTKKETK